MVCFVSGLVVGERGRSVVGCCPRRRVRRCGVMLASWSNEDSPEENVFKDSDNRENGELDMEALRKRISDLEMKRRVYEAREEEAALTEAVASHQKGAKHGLWVMLSNKRVEGEDYVTLKVNNSDTVLGFEMEKDANKCAELIGISSGNNRSPRIVKRTMNTLEKYCSQRGCQLGIVPKGAVEVQQVTNEEASEIVAEVERASEGVADCDSVRRELEDLFRRS